MANYSRRTHIVRISDAKAGDPPSDTYVDVEVLDAIAFRIENNREIVINLDNKNAVPYIVDDTGGGHGKEPALPTRRSHMKRVRDPATGSALDIEVIDALACRDINGGEWVLSMPKEGVAPYNATTGGGSSPTRRTHNEKVSSDPSKPNPTKYLTVERSDAVAFRLSGNREMVLSMASSDDPRSANKRAPTFLVSPATYDPANESGPKPKPNSDPNVYVAFVKGAPDCYTMDQKLAQGPFWWIRKVSAGSSPALAFLMFDSVQSSFGTAPTQITATFKIADAYGAGFEWDVFGDKKYTQPGGKADTDISQPIVTDAMVSAFYQWTPLPPYHNLTTGADGGYTIWYVTNGFGINAENYQDDAGAVDNCGNALKVIGAYGGTFLNCNSTVTNYLTAHNIPWQSGGDGTFTTEADAQEYANAINYWAAQNAGGSSYSIGSIQVTSPTTSYTLTDRAIWVLNVDAISKLVKAKNPNAKSFNYTITVSATSPNVTNNWDTGGGSYSKKKSPAPDFDIKSFPVGSTNFPTWDKYPDASLHRSTGVGGTITGKVTFDPPEDLKIELSTDISAGGGGAQ